MHTRYSVHPEAYQHMNSKELRQNFLVDDLFKEGKLDLLYWENERAVIGSAIPTTAPLQLEAGKELAAEFFLQRREAGILNIGATGSVTVDGTTYEMANRDCLYLGKGVKDVTFASADPAFPARFYILSYPAHTTYPTMLAKRGDATPVHLGSKTGCNERTIYKYIHREGIQSCQLVMGFTELAPGSVWNTMPCHMHARRTEVYLYFGIDTENVVFHLMGPPGETKHIIMRNEQIALSPIWSIHSGCGTGAYAFIWGMGGENQAFGDMDPVSMDELAGN
jgi:4-deoxy-L-threo-5-hexosulose-uronate ketol-isomerase